MNVYNITVLVPIASSATPHAFILEVADCPSRMLEVCRALGLEEAWHRAAKSEDVCLMGVSVMPIARAKIDIDCRDINGIPISEGPDVARELANVERAIALCAQRGARAFVGYC